MKILKQSEVDLLESLAKSETELINKAFGLSKEHGLLHLSNAITSFKDYIKSKYGEVVISGCSEYRIFIVALLKGVDKQYMDDTFSEILIPNMDSVNDEDVLRVYSKLF